MFFIIKDCNLKKKNKSHYEKYQKKIFFINFKFKLTFIWFTVPHIKMHFYK